MARQLLEFSDDDLALVARLIVTDTETLRAELVRRPWYANDVLRRPEVVDAVLHDTGFDQLRVSPLLFFAVLTQQAAEDLASSDVVADWVGAGCRLPVFDVEPLQEFADAPARLAFVARLLLGFSLPAAAPVPVDRYDLDELVDWLDAVGPEQQILLLKQLGDLALFRAGVFPDSTGPVSLSAAQAEHLGRSVRMSDDELGGLVDPGSPTCGLDALEKLSAAWYRAAAESSPSTPVVVRDVANRIRSARRFLNHLSDRYLHRLQPSWGPLG